MKHSPIKVSIFHFVRLIFINLQGFPNHASQNYPASSTSQRLQIILKHLVLSYQYTRTSVQTHCFKRRREKIIIFLVCTYRKKTHEMLLGTICFTHILKFINFKDWLTTLALLVLQGILFRKIKNSSLYPF